MSWEELKKIISSSDNKVIIVEDGKPVYVLMSFDYYQKHFESIDGKNKENYEGEKDERKTEKEDKRGELTIDDLPL